jgi:hypothetical protein
MGRRGFPVRPGDPNSFEGKRWVAVHSRRGKRERLGCVIGFDPRHAGNGCRCSAWRNDDARTTRNGISDKPFPMRAQTGSGDESIAAFDTARVVMDARDERGGVSGNEV